MDFKNFQIRAVTTDQNPKISTAEERANSEPKKHEIIPLLGLVGEVGGLLSEYKKMLRDGAVYEQFPDQVAEELGDILWYVATVATKFNLKLDEIAENTIKKAEDRWHPPGKRKSLADAAYPADQQIPRKFSYKFSHEEVKGKQKLTLTDITTGKPVGDPLTDNAYEDDGYRFHDIFHLAFAVHFGWSPVYRKLLRDKGLVQRRSPDAIDTAEDGGRAQVIDEAIVAASYVYAEKHAFLKGLNAIDWQLLRHLQQMTANLEVKNRTTGEWNAALIHGFKVWRKLRDNNGGIVTGDLDAGTLEFTPLK